MIRSGRTRRNILATTCRLAAPAFVVEEVNRHWALVLRKSGMPNPVAKKLLKILMDRMEAIGDEHIISALPRAHDLLGAVDVNDVPYLAAAFAIGADAIWSFDPHFDRQQAIPRVESLDDFDGIS